MLLEFLTRKCLYLSCNFESVDLDIKARLQINVERIPRWVDNIVIHAWHFLRIQSWNDLTIASLRVRFAPVAGIEPISGIRYVKLNIFKEITIV